MRYNIKYLESSNSYQIEIFNSAKHILEHNYKVGLDVFTSGGKSPLSAELINYLYENFNCTNTVVVSSESTWLALTSKYKQIGLDLSKIYHVKNSDLSRGKRLKDCINESGIDYKDVDIFLFDECHHLFGDNIHKEIESNKDYIYSKYLIAMTATTITGVKMINSLNELVGAENIVKYNLNDAVNNDVIDPITMINVSLNSKDEYNSYMSSLQTKTVSNRELAKLIDRANKACNNDILDSVESIIHSNIVRGCSDNRHKIALNASKGARVLVFFNRIEDVNTYRQILINVISNIYTGAYINYIEYTSKSSDSDMSKAIDVLTSDKATNNTVDIIATCDIGAESFHPVNMQLGLIFGGTQSIRRELQRIGRFVVLKKYKTSDCIIFDFSNTIKKLGKTTINIGNTEVESRLNDIANLSRYFNDSPSDISDALSEFEGAINIESSTIDDNIFNEINLISNLYNITENNKDIIKYIDDNLKEIDDIYLGNIAKYLYENNIDNIYERYEAIRTAIIYPLINSKEYKILKKSFGKYGVRNYYSRYIKYDKLKYTRELYNSIINKAFTARDYKYKYIQNDMTSECRMLIRSSSEALTKLYDSIINSDATGIGIARTDFMYSKITVMLKILKAIPNSSGKELSELRAMLTVCYRYILAYINTLPKTNITRIKLSNLIILMNDNKVRLNKLKRNELKNVDNIIAIDLYKNLVNNEYIDNTELENVALSICFNKPSKIVLNTITMCSLGTNKTYDEYMDEILSMTKAYNYVSNAYNKKTYESLRMLKEYIEKGNYVHSTLIKNYEVDKLLAKYTKLETIINSIETPESINTKGLKPFDILNLIINDSETTNYIEGMNKFKNGVIDDQSGKNYNNYLGILRHKITDDKKYTLQKLSKLKIFRKGYYRNIINDICDK